MGQAVQFGAAAPDEANSGAPPMTTEEPVAPTIIEATTEAKDVEVQNTGAWAALSSGSVAKPDPATAAPTQDLSKFRKLAEEKKERERVEAESAARERAKEEAAEAARRQEEAAKREEAARSAEEAAQQKLREEQEAREKEIAERQRAREEARKKREAMEGTVDLHEQSNLMESFNES